MTNWAQLEYRDASLGGDAVMLWTTDVSYKLDTTAPDVDVQVDGWDVAVSATDPLPAGVAENSGIATCELRVDEGEWADCEATSTLEPSIVDRTVTVRATDNAGNETTATATVEGSGLVSTSIDTRCVGSKVMLIVTVTIPFALQWSGLHGLDILPPTVRHVWWPGLAMLALATGAGAWVMERLGRANPWFMGALLVSMGITLGGWQLSAIPPWASNAAQLVIGVSLGVRFTAQFLHTAPRWLGTVAVGTLAMVALCAGFAWLLTLGTGLHAATLVLGTAPGGIAEMSITAKVLQLGVPVVTAFQVCRLVTVLVIVDPFYKRFIAQP